MKNLYLFIIIIVFNNTLFSQDILQAYDTVTFEKPCEYLLIDTSSDNIWKIGKPNKILFNSAYSQDSAIATNLKDYYPKNNHSFFDIKIGEFNLNNYRDNFFIGLKHKYDTDARKDGGYITVSHDRGKSWINIINDTISQTLSHCWPIAPSNGFKGHDFGNLYSKQDTLFNGEFGFSGSSDDWVNTWFSWHCLLANKAENRSIYQSDTTILRFNFISDSIDTKKEGWMIDDILLFSGDIGSGVNDIVQDIFTISPNPMKESTTISFDN